MALPNPGMDFTAFDTLPAASLDDMVENIEALADGSGLDDGAVTNAKLNLSGSQRATVATSQTTTSTSYADLSTVGPAVTVTIGSSGLALVIMEMTASSNVAGNANLNMSFAASGTNTITAGTQGQMKMGSFAGGVGMTHSFERLLTGLTPGSTTFTAKYSTTSGTATFSDRFLTVIPL